MSGKRSKQYLEKTTDCQDKSYAIGLVSGLAAILMFTLSFTFCHMNKNKEIKPYRIIPEYERTMKQIVISLGIKNKTLDLHSELLESLPEYSRIIVLLPNKNIPDIRSELKDKSYAERTRLIGFDVKNYTNEHVYFIFPEKNKIQDTGNLKDPPDITGSLWAQDLFESARNNEGSLVLLAPDVHKWFASFGGDPSIDIVSDISFLGCFSSSDIEVQRLPLTFRGGNILVDEYKNKRIALCGGDVYRLTKTVWKGTRSSVPSDRQITQMIKQLFNVSKVVVVGKEKVQPSRMFHLDQAMIFLPDRVAAVARVVDREQVDNKDLKDIEDVDLFLSELRSTLKNMGYRLIDINLPANNALKFQHQVNGIPYINEKTGQRTYLMPVFRPDQPEYENGLVEKNRKAFESIGYSVIQVATNAHEINGGIHCMVNVLE